MMRLREIGPRFVSDRAALLIAVLVLAGGRAPLAGPAVAERHGNAGGGSHTRSGWERVLASLGERRATLADDLDAARPVLRARAEREAPGLSDRLLPAPALVSGYGVLPEIVEDPPLGSIEPTETRYSLRWLEDRHTASFRDAAALVQRARAEEHAPLEPLVAEYERLRSAARDLDSHLAYHAQWQRVVAARPGAYTDANRSIARLREAQAAPRGAGATDRLEQARADAVRQLARFARRPGLTIESAVDGLRVLPVRVHTDIEDETIRDALRDGVEQSFNRSAAAVALRFSIRLELRVVLPTELYPEGRPARGSSLDVAKHLARFPPGSLVLTTGAASTIVTQGTAIVLGPQPIGRRTLAHEFAHLLGFDDAYLRGYDGDLDGDYGPVLVEWTGLQDDLMGGPGIGRVTPEMIRTLIENYGTTR